MCLKFLGAVSQLYTAYFRSLEHLKLTYHVNIVFLFMYLYHFKQRKEMILFENLQQANIWCFCLEELSPK